MKLKNKIAVGLAALALGSAVLGRPALSIPPLVARYSPMNCEVAIMQRSLEEKLVCARDYIQENYEGILITGTKLHIAGIKFALDLIKQNDPDNWENVKKNITKITLTGHSGINVRNGRWSTGDYFDKLRDKCTVEYVAGSVVHEAWHVIYFKNKEPYRGREGERKCLERENEFREKIGYRKVNIEKALETEYWKVPYEKRWW